MTRSNPGFHTVQIGDITVTALNDGQFEVPAAIVVGVSADQAESQLRASFRSLPPRITVSCFLVETEGRRVLIDAGTGGSRGAVLGHAGEKLATLGTPPESIDTILLTHGHIDHLGGLTDAAGKPVFERAELLIHEIEAEFWTSESIYGRTPEERRGAFDVARRVLSAYSARTRRIKDGEAVAPGLTARLLPGHTPGHSGCLIASGKESLLMWTDVVHLPGIQFERPDVGLTFDVDVEQARATRARVFDEAAADRLLVAGIHLDFPTFGHVLRRGAAYAFEPLVWTPSAAGLFA